MRILRKRRKVKGELFFINQLRAARSADTDSKAVIISHSLGVSDMKLAYDIYEPEVTRSSLNPIILHHGILETRVTWKYVGPSLARDSGRKVYAIDARNHGESPWTEEYNSGEMVNDLEEFLEDHGIKRAILIGHSMGGRVSIMYALQKPEKVELLVVEDVPVRKFKPRSDSRVTVAFNVYKGMLNYLEQIQDKTEAEQYIRDMCSSLTEFISVPSDFFTTFDMELMPFKWNGKQFKSQMNVDVIRNAIISNTLEQEFSGRYEGEALFLVGGRSPFKTGQDPLVEKFFPRASKVYFKNSGHFIHTHVPAEFLREVVHFINSRTKQPSKY